MPWFIIFLLLSISFSYTSASTTIRGHLFGYNGNPMQAAYILYWDKDIQKTVEPDSSGYFELTTNSRYFLEIEFIGSNHQNFRTTIPIDSTLIMPEFNIKLRPNQCPENFKRIWLVGSFNYYQIGMKMVELKNQSGNFYSADIHSKDDTLWYKILFDNGNLWEYDAVDVPNADFYRLDEFNNLLSGKLTKNGMANITLDLSDFPQGEYAPQILSNDVHYNKTLELFKKIRNIFNNFRNQSEIFNSNISKLDKSKRDTAYIAFCETYLDSLNRIINESGNNKSVRIYSIFNNLMIATDAVNKGRKSIFTNIYPEEMNYFNEFINIFPQSSDFWDNPGYNRLALDYDLITNNKLDSGLTNDIIKSHHSETANNLLLDVMRVAKKKNDSILIDKFYAKMLKEYPDSRRTLMAKMEFDKDLKIEDGKMLPEFLFQNFDDTTKIISNNTLKGKFVLISVWDMGYGPSVEEISYLDSAYNKYKNKNFTILSIALDNKNKVKNFRKNYWEMPWLNVVDEKGIDSKVNSLFEVYFKTKTILIDPEGKILAVGLELSYQNLDITLQRYIK